MKYAPFVESSKYSFEAEEESAQAKDENKDGTIITRNNPEMNDEKSKNNSDGKKEIKKIKAENSLGITTSEKNGPKDESQNQKEKELDNEDKPNKSKTDKNGSNQKSESQLKEETTKTQTEPDIFNAKERAGINTNGKCVHALGFKDNEDHESKKESDSNCEGKNKRNNTDTVMSKKTEKGHPISKQLEEPCEGLQIFPQRFKVTEDNLFAKLDSLSAQDSKNSNLKKL